ncbi:phosphopantetheinyl transferase [Methanocella paludicola SANAE]|uniref:Phosphopantetheinyl transferase n=1 Tax=Methanocella paludicola (strain DSM 17711 / JCM 13418 / NBRC 101707 / SANAE) TaxID=304371 RepID=D1YV34_METPS|nr:4'-phosphopantetheinyl transferase superfamily protein [Methanocella paludicola]BAI60306.1 phosphopantetheinyl transferase [Methanocella paludicola SANAE]
MTLEMPGPGEVHVRVVSLEHSTGELPMECLDEGEMDTFRRFRRETDAGRYLAAHEALRHILASYLGIEPDAIRYVRGPHGKPYLEPAIHGGRLRFNLSHSGGIAAIAVTDGLDVGVDVEQVRDMEFEELASCAFSRDEQAALGNNNIDSGVFFRLWTRKEAYLKATGLGLSVQPNEATIGEGWSIIDIDPAPGYAGAVAVEGPIARVSVFRPPE